MRLRSRLIVPFALALFVCLLSACTGRPDRAPTPRPGGAVVIRGCLPQSPLIPADSTEVCGGQMIDAITSRLVHYNTETAESELDIAQSIETTDNQHFTIKIKPGYRFQDGTEIKAKNFTDAWAANVACHYASSYFFEPIEGFAELDATTGKCGARTAGLPGLAVLDDHTFTIKTTQPVSNLPTRLGYAAFAPLPDAYFVDPVKYGRAPIGSGPFKLSWVNDQFWTLERFPGYSGKYPASVDRITFKLYADPDAAFTDLVAGTLDFTDSIPADQLANDAWRKVLQDRASSREAGVIESLGFAPGDPQLKDVRKRQALSMAVNRRQITRVLYAGSRVPANGWVSPVVDGFKPGACGETCHYDEARAKQLWQESGGYQGPLNFYVNVDGGHKPFADAVCKNWHKVLGVDCRVIAVPTLKALEDQKNNREFTTGVFRTGWSMDYPHVESFLSPMYRTGASSNVYDYSNPEFDSLLDQADAAVDPFQANRLYQQAETVLAKDLPTVPLWYASAAVGWSAKVTNVRVNSMGLLDLSTISVA